MPQISLYIDQKTLRQVESSAQREHLSISKWVAAQIKGKLAPAYPADFSSLFGSITDDSFGRPHQPAASKDAKRQRL